MMVGVIIKKDVYVVRPKGIYEHKMAAEIEGKIFDLCARGASKFILDLLRVKGILSRGVHSLIEVYDRIKEVGGTVKLCGLQRDVKFFLQFAQLNEVFEIFPDQNEALLSYGVHLRKRSMPEP
jgi:anti-sigma B factor antagonist